MNILFFGRGVISSQYAYLLEKAGHQVTFYVRNPREDVLNLDILDARKNPFGKKIRGKWKTNLIEEIPEKHDYDLIMVSIQHYHIKDALFYLKDKIDNATLLIYNNMWDEPLELIEGLPSQQIVWGFPGAGGGFNKDGVLNGAVFSRFTIGTFGTEPSPRNLEVQELLKTAGFKIDFQKDFRSWLFIHFAVNASMHLESMKKDSFSKALDSYQAFRNIHNNAKELLPLLTARGVDMTGKVTELKKLKMPAWVLYLTLKALPKIYAPLKKVLLEHSNPTELRAYAKDVLDEAKKWNIKLPSFEKCINMIKKEKA